MRRFSRITTVQLARICGVSQGTVDRALHGRADINPETRERILSVAREYDYVPGIRGRTSDRSLLIGVVLYDLYNEFFSKLAMSLVNAARTVGYSVIFQFSDKSPEGEKRALEYFDYIGVDGIILFSVGSDSEEYAAYLRSLNKPLVLIGNRLAGLPYIGVDDRAAMYDLVARLAKEGLSGKIAYYAPILKQRLHAENAQRLRLSGFLAAAEELGLSGGLVTEAEDARGCAAAVCATDYYALALLRKLGEETPRILTGFDNISLLQTVSTPILTVDYSTDKIADACMQYILGGKYDPCIPYRLIRNTDQNTK